MKKGVGYDNINDDTWSLHGWTWNRSDESRKANIQNKETEEKNFFVRLGESGNPKYNWMGGYTESD